jgi:hypothetical protein
MEHIKEKEITRFSKKTVSFATNENLDIILDQSITLNINSTKKYEEDDHNNKEKTNYNKSCKSIVQIRTDMFYKNKSTISKSCKKINSENKSQKDLLNDNIKISMFNHVAKEFINDSFNSDDNKKEVDLNNNKKLKLKTYSQKYKDLKRNKISNLDMNLANYFENDLEFKLEEESENEDIEDYQDPKISNEYSNVFNSNLITNKLKLDKFEKGEENLAATRNRSTSIFNMMEINIIKRKSKANCL